MVEADVDKREGREIAFVMFQVMPREDCYLGGADNTYTTRGGRFVIEVYVARGVPGERASTGARARPCWNARLAAEPSRKVARTHASTAIRHSADFTVRLSSCRFHQRHCGPNSRQQRALENIIFSRALSGCGDPQQTPSETALVGC
jgi:hypothetical protein